MIRIETTFKPCSVNRRYNIRHGKLILSKEYRDSKTFLQNLFYAECRRKKWQTTKEPVSVEIEIGFKRYDIDAVIKPLLDAMEGTVYLNDKQVQILNVIKIPDDKIIVQVSV